MLLWPWFEDIILVVVEFVCLLFVVRAILLFYAPIIFPLNKQEEARRVGIARQVILNVICYDHELSGCTNIKNYYC